MRNWKTTLFGALGAAVQVALPLIQTGTVSIKDIAIAAALALIGYFAKDAGISGTDK